MAHRWSLTGGGGRPASKECGDEFEIAVLLDRAASTSSPVRIMSDASERGPIGSDRRVVVFDDAGDGSDDDDGDDDLHQRRHHNDRISGVVDDGDNDDEERIMIFEDRRPLRGERNENAKGRWPVLCSVYIYAFKLGFSSHWRYVWWKIGLYIDHWFGWFQFNQFSTRLHSV